MKMEETVKNEAPKPVCTILCRKIFQGQDYNRVVSVDGVVPKESGIIVIQAYTILDKAKIDKLVSLGCVVNFENIQDFVMHDPFKE